MTNSVYTTPETKKLRRSRTDKMLTGVCGGVAKYFGVEASIVRIVAVAATVISFGVAVPVYIAAMFLMPEDETDS